MPVLSRNPKGTDMACLCVFAGAATGTEDAFSTRVYELATALSQAGHSFIYGGGRTGLMGAFADGVIDQAGHIEGVIPAFLSEREVAHQNVSKLTITETMHERKTLMYQPADGFLILPGGIGTLEETMEVLTWRQLGKLDGPVFTFSPDGFWQPLHDLVSHIEATGFAHSEGFGTIYWHEDVTGLVSSCERHFSDS